MKGKINFVGFLFLCNFAPVRLSRALVHRNIAVTSRSSKQKMSSALFTSPEDSAIYKSKRTVFIRHDCTFMNEHLAMPGCSMKDPNFSDVFLDDEESEGKYRDSPLSPKGIEQARQLRDLLDKGAGGHEELSLSLEDKHIMEELDLVVISPLTRTLQTFEISLLSHIQSSASEYSSNRKRHDVPVIALPFAAERVYLISDLGKIRSELRGDYGHIVNFETGFEHMKDKDGEWWFTNNVEDTDYIEWRPDCQGQTYACPGEPENVFRKRMRSLYEWLDNRPESTIALVCHWGVIDSMLGGADFKNCEMRVVPFRDIPNKKIMPN